MTAKKRTTRLAFNGQRADAAAAEGWEGVSSDVSPRARADRVKRAIDLVGAGAALIVLSPILAGAAVLVRLTSKGPALFWQDRYGRDEKRFQVVKFRTMVVDQAALIDLVAVEAREARVC